MHYNSVAFIFRAYQVHPIENGIFSCSPHVIFSAYEIIQENSGLLKSQTDVIFQKCRSKVSLDIYAEKDLPHMTCIFHIFKYVVKKCFSVGHISSHFFAKTLT